MEFGEVHPHRVFERHGERAGVDAELRRQLRPNPRRPGDPRAPQKPRERERLQHTGFREIRAPRRCSNVSGLRLHLRHQGGGAGLRELGAGHRGGERCLPHHVGERRLRQRTVRFSLGRGDRRERKRLRRRCGREPHPEVRCERYLPHQMGEFRFGQRTGQLPRRRGDRRERERLRRRYERFSITIGTGRPRQPSCTRGKDGQTPVL